MKAPPRLLDDPTLAPELRSDLERAATTTPVYDVAAGLAGLQAVIAASSAVSASSASAAHASAQASVAPAASAAATATAGKAAVLGVLSTKAALAALIGAAALTATIAWPKTPAPRPGNTTTATTTATATATTTSTTTSTTTPAAAVVAPVPAAPSASTAEATLDTAKPASADARREITQLARIKALVDSDPARAYQLAQRGEREFARGVLQQERAALAIVALANSGRRAEAERRMRAFLVRYPNSPARERLDAVLGTARE